MGQAMRFAKSAGWCAGVCLALLVGCGAAPDREPAGRTADTLSVEDADGDAEPASKECVCQCLTGDEGKPIALECLTQKPRSTDYRLTAPMGSKTAADCAREYEGIECLGGIPGGQKVDKGKVSGCIIQVL